MDAASLDPGAAFLELGLDSLFLTQAALTLQKTFGVKISFRELLEELSTIDALAAHLDGVLPAEATPAPAAATASAAAAPALAPAGPARSASAPRPAERGRAADRRAARDHAPAARDAARHRQRRRPPRRRPRRPSRQPAPRRPRRPSGRAEPRSRRRGAGAGVRPATGRRPRRRPAGSRPSRSRRCDAFIERYTRRTAGSKSSTAAHRPHLADPASVAGFRPLWKEIVYPIVTVRSAGSRLWDVDGNEYVDLTNGFGTILFGHNPDFVREALQAQLDQGIEIGPQTPLAGEVAARVAAMVGMERVAFCNTGSEAVMAAIRARAHRHRPRPDRAVRRRLPRHLRRGARPTRRARARCRSPPASRTSMLDNVVVLDYGSPDALELPEGPRRRARRRPRRAGAEPPSRPPAPRVPARAAPPDRGLGHGARLRRGRHRLPLPPRRRPGALRRPRRPRHLRQGHRRRAPDRPRRRPARVHGRARRRRLAVRRRLDPRGRRHVLRRHVRPPSARARRGARRARPARGAGARPPARPQPPDDGVRLPARGPRAERRRPGRGSAISAPGSTSTSRATSLTPGSSTR